MPHLFSPYQLKDIRLKNRIVMSPMTMYRSVDGCMTDFHVMLMGSRAAGGFGLVFPEQIAITPDGRTSVGCAGIWSDAQLDGLARVTRIIKDMGAVPAIQLGHTGRKGSLTKPWEGNTQLPPGHSDGWQVRGPSSVPYGGRSPLPVHELSVEEIKELHRAYADAARRAEAAGFEWLELHFAHGYLGSAFFSPLANKRSDAYGGSLDARLRFHLEALDAVQEVWPERLPLTVRLGSDDLHPEGIQFEEAIYAISRMKEHGMDLADISFGFNTDAMLKNPLGVDGAMVERGARIRREAGVPVGVSWNLGQPKIADEAIREELIDLVLLGRPALANPHWPFWAARELGLSDPLSHLPEDWSWWLRRSGPHDPNLGWPSVAPQARPGETLE
jgi:2,4-dienoyl-CoA reductase-like NADH-dependent reductase (Old Yellow Enzyme family)